jgi:hypothetical protein
VPNGAGRPPSGATLTSMAAIRKLRSLSRTPAAAVAVWIALVCVCVVWMATHWSNEPDCQTNNVERARLEQPPLPCPDD